MVPLLAAATLPEGYDQICSIGGRPSHCRDPWDDSIRNPIWLPGPPFDASALPSSSLLWIGAPEPDPHRCCLLLAACCLLGGQRTKRTNATGMESGRALSRSRGTGTGTWYWLPSSSSLR
ncbi:hypothetical protein TEQG_01095 [Trichophyton equinum CBS 127.97]|uniref:Uncharacterized protein n=1 Tax=Trichophyton equinum (strain ATCC MYA-4606 / CBS 127.97) TaxID=559882 RepID=F2PJI8_TRIEC|nr:hypothetical protein TEQG_01095 [Trichophyton equinum CBS 127.97]